MEQSIFKSLSEILSSANIDSVSSESAGFDELPEGYYLCEVVKGEITSSSTNHDPMAVLTLKVINNGYDVYATSGGEIEFKEIKNCNNRRVWLYYLIKDEKSLKKFVSDMLKFEGDEPGESLLPKEAFTTPETLEDALNLLEEQRIYIQVSTTEKDGKSSVWKNLVSWKRVSALGLPQ